MIAGLYIGYPILAIDIRERFDAPSCVRCGYPVHDPDNLSGQCSECGASLSAPEAVSDSRPWRIKERLWIGVPLLAGMFISIYASVLFKIF